MGLLDTLARFAPLRPTLRTAPRKKSPKSRKPRKLAYGELMEPRRLMAADIHVGVVYFADTSGLDQEGDRFEVTFSGGAAGTQLTELRIDTDKMGNGLAIGDAFFHTEPGPPGVFGHAPLEIVSLQGIGSVTFDVENGGQLLVMRFQGFEAGDRLIFTVDVDELAPGGPTPVVEGREFEGSIFSATFTHPNYFDATGADIFLDLFDHKLDQLNLDLPRESYSPPAPTPQTVLTAGAMFPLEQVPLPITISGTVFEDINLNNVQDPGDPGIAGVEIALWQWNGSQYVDTGVTTTTNSAGDYSFEDVLPGQYQLVQTQPDGYFSVGATAGTVDGSTRGVVTTPDIISGVVLVGGEDSIRNDFAEARPGTLSGYVYHDRNNDGIRDPGEEGIAGVTIEVQHILSDGSAGATTTVVTGANGLWVADGLMPGEYVVREFQPDGWLNGLVTAGTAGGTAHNPGDLIDGIFLASGQVGQEYNFGELLPVEIHGLVHADLNGNCILDPGEQPLAGVTIYLLDQNGVRIDSTTTGADGRYSFTDLHPGVYGVEEIQPDGYFQGGTKVGTAGGTVAAQDIITGIVLTSGQIGLDYNFCEHPPSSIWGYVFEDDNNDGVRDPGEAGIGGVIITLLDANGQSTGITTVTAADGSYHFVGLEPGTYGVFEHQPDGYFSGINTPGTAGGIADPPPGDRITEIVLMPGVDAMEYNFGELRPASISGFVYEDDNNNGVFDAGEAGIGGVTLTLLDANGQSTGITTITAANGFYRFDGLEPGTYGVRETQPAGYLDGLDSVGSAGGTVIASDVIVGAVLTPGMAATDYNFGELRPASISGLVFADLDADGAYTPGDTPIAGVTVYLLDTSGTRIAEAITASDGTYSFVDLRPGTYGVEEIQPEGYFHGGEIVGSHGGTILQDDMIVDITLTTGDVATGYDFYEHPPAIISGFVFVDGPPIMLEQGEVFDSSQVGEYRDGVRKEDDLPLAGVVLRLGNFVGQPVLDSFGQAITTVTDANGFYQFSGLRPGVYSILQEQPEGYINGIDTPGTTGGIAINPGTEVTPELLAVPHDFNAIVRVPVLPGQVSLENNFSEVLVQTLPPPPPELPLLFPNIQPNIPAPFLRPQLNLPPAIGGPFFAGPTIIAPPAVFRGSGGFTIGNYTWHLSVIDAGQVRGESGEDDEGFVFRAGARYNAMWNRGDMAQSRWQLDMGDGESPQEIDFGMEDGIPVTGDWNGDGVTQVGVYYKGNWYLDLNGNGVWDEDDLWIQLGSEHDLPVTGDWDGDGKTDIGIFGPEWPGDPRAIANEPGLPNSENKPAGRPKNLPPKPHEAPWGHRRMRLTMQSSEKADLIDHVFHYGTSGDYPITGDWNGDGTESIGIFRGGLWLLDVDGDGRWKPGDLSFRMGQPGDIPVVGDFTGDGVVEMGVYRNGVWHIDTNHDRVLDAHDMIFEFGEPGDLPIVGDWNGDGIDQPGVYRNGEVIPK